VTRLGEVTLHRPYWHCDRCGQGHFTDALGDRLPAGQASWALKRTVARLCVHLPFAQAVAEVQALLGLTVSARSAEGWVEAIGAAYTPATPTPTDPGPVVDTVFLEVDAVQVPFRDGWHEEKVCVAWGRVGGRDQRLHYAVGEGPWDQQAAVIAGVARRAGSRLAREVVCLADGAGPIWTTLTRLYPAARQVLDWYHLQEHLAEVAALLPDGAGWQDTQRETLAAHGPRATFRALAQLVRTGETVAVREAARRCFSYMTKHRHRLDYPAARALGYPIGSGRIESACKQVVTTRCKGPGMRWNHPHAQAVLWARCAWLNGEWESAVEQARRAA
jgi:hypothetical protein